LPSPLHLAGFLAGETNQYRPRLYNDQTPVEPPTQGINKTDYTLNEDLVSRLIS
jgi:hypothetical protein